MILRWLRNRKRLSIVSGPTSPNWYPWLDQSIPWYQLWTPTLQQKFIANLKIFVAEKYWEGCAGMEVDERVKVFIAAQAAMMLMGVENYCFDRLRTVLVFPSQFVRESGDGVFVWKESRIGEAWQRGPIVIAWKEFVEGLNYGQNVVVHELAHHIDGIRGDFSGTPSFGNRRSIKLWEQISRRERQQLQMKLNRGEETLLDPYGAESPVEFFAVCSEAFFESPRELMLEHPQLYQALTSVYHCEPANW